MSNRPDRLQAALERAAAGLEPGAVMAVERHVSAGTPSFWEERLGWRHGHEERYRTVRSSVDEGGAPIGTWSGPALPERGTELAAALLETELWGRPSTPVEPGEDLVTWRVVAHDATATYSCPATHPGARVFGQADMLLRRVANTLVKAGSGAALVVELKLTPTADMVVAEMVLHNAGKEAGLLPNPLRVRGPADANYFRIELAPPEQDAPGTTGLGPVFAPVDFEAPSALPAPWDRDHLVLAPGARLALPVLVPVRRDVRPGSLLRAVWSCYGAPERVAGMPVLGGRAFSRETPLPA